MARKVAPSQLLPDRVIIPKVRSFDLYHHRFPPIYPCSGTAAEPFLPRSLPLQQKRRLLTCFDHFGMSPMPILCPRDITRKSPRHLVPRKPEQIPDHLELCTGKRFPQHTNSRSKSRCQRIPNSRSSICSSPPPIAITEFSFTSSSNRRIHPVSRSPSLLYKLTRQQPRLHLHTKRHTTPPAAIGTCGKLLLTQHGFRHSTCSSAL